MPLIEVQLQRRYFHYFAGEWPACATVTEHMRPWVERYGTPFQRARFLNDSEWTLQRDRYVVADETLVSVLATLAR